MMKKWKYSFIKNLKYEVNGDDDTTGTPISDFRYRIFINGEKVVFDKSTYTATPGAGTAWYDFPGTISLNAGVNTIRIAMAGGWIHTFYQFGYEVALAK